MRAIWKGAVAFGLVNVPVKLYAATGEHEVPLHQVHRKDAGRIRYAKKCSICGETVEMSDLAKGYETDDGQMVVLSDEDLAELPLSTEREISVLEFVPANQVDPIMLAKTYYLEPEKTAAKPYALLREALAATERMAVVKVALRQRESMAVLRVRDDVICLQTLLWPDEVREADFPVLDTDITVRPQELSMASSLVESLASDFDPSAFEDTYQAALEQLIEAKVAAGGATPLPDESETAASSGRASGGEVIDLLSALQRSVEKARAARGEPAGGPERASGTKRARTASAPPAARKTRKATAADDGPGERVTSAPAAPAPSKPRVRTRRAAAEPQPETTATARKARTKAS
ncbi:Ku protein [Cellulomonas sp. WB94]|uniref:non-homologous end joining protein Ku n=1 Tax=Cellulomonas sp. WB94 TaxID=2173174 RepID=UPI000D5747CC|nr:Ku protein [Cellulomonas sp. WB94]PVU81183.1 Ku protein [Cellulomonas sp. WB94]